MLQINTSSLNRYSARLSKTANRIQNIYVNDLLLQMGEVSLNILKKNAPKRTGKLQDSLYYKVAGNEITFWSKLDSQRQKPWWKARTAYWQTKGTGVSGGYIYPKRARFLKVPLPGGGFIYRKRVRGQQPNPFDIKSIPEIRQQIGTKLPGLGDIIVTDLAGRI